MLGAVERILRCATDSSKYGNFVAVQTRLGNNIDVSRSSMSGTIERIFRCSSRHPEVW
jgi:hypothetical protein